MKMDKHTLELGFAIWYKLYERTPKRQQTGDGTGEHCVIWLDYQPGRVGQGRNHRGAASAKGVLKSLHGYLESVPQASQLIDVCLLIKSDAYQSTFPRPSVHKGSPHPHPWGGTNLQAVLLMDTRLPGVWRSIIMFLALGQTGLRPSIKLKSNQRKVNEKDLTARSHQPYFYRKGDRKRRRKNSL